MSDKKTKAAKAEPAHPQRHLAILFSVGGIGGLDRPSPTAGWLWRADAAAEWLARARPLFPKASGGELAALAILPDDARHLVASALCGVSPKSADSGVGTFCSAPAFLEFTDSCALCSIRGTLPHNLDSARGKACLARAARQLTTHLSRSLPLAAPMPLELWALGSPADIEGAMLATLDQRELVAALPPKARARSLARHSL